MTLFLNIKSDIKKKFHPRGPRIYKPIVSLLFPTRAMPVTEKCTNARLDNSKHKRKEGRKEGKGKGDDRRGRRRRGEREALK